MSAECLSAWAAESLTSFDERIYAPNLSLFVSPCFKLDYITFRSYSATEYEDPILKDDLLCFHEQDRISLFHYKIFVQNHS